MAFEFYRKTRNLVEIQGFVTKEPYLWEEGDKKALYLQMSSTEQGFGDGSKDIVTWHNSITISGVKRAALAKQLISKGDLIVVKGSLRYKNIKLSEGKYVTSCTIYVTSYSPLSESKSNKDDDLKDYPTDTEQEGDDGPEGF
ncbi:MAG: single-stranded DNA-binding protein [Candidatus Peribacteraceae bacterium]|nr:single-stranded DNA-binding protein [Candidatus Peribacteraceae bacterium]